MPWGNRLRHTEIYWDHWIHWFLRISPGTSEAFWKASRKSIEVSIEVLPGPSSYTTGAPQQRGHRLRLDWRWQALQRSSHAGPGSWPFRICMDLLYLVLCFCVNIFIHFDLHLLSPWSLLSFVPLFHLFIHSRKQATIVVVWFYFFSMRARLQFLYAVCLLVRLHVPPWEQVHRSWVSKTECWDQQDNPPKKALSCHWATGSGMQRPGIVMNCEQSAATAVLNIFGKDRRKDFECALCRLCRNQVREQDPSWFTFAALARLVKWHVLNLNN